MERVELLLKKKKTSHGKKNLKMRFLWGERFDKTEQRDFGREVVLLVVVKLVDLVMLYHYYDAHVFFNN